MAEANGGRLMSALGPLLPVLAVVFVGGGGWAKLAALEAGQAEMRQDVKRIDAAVVRLEAKVR